MDVHSYHFYVQNNGWMFLVIIFMVTMEATFLEVTNEVKKKKCGPCVLMFKCFFTLLFLTKFKTLKIIMKAVL